jgi:hypothetical protein
VVSYYMPNWMCLMRAGMRSTTCCLAEVRGASMMAQVVVLYYRANLMLPGVFTVLIFLHSRRVVSHVRGDSRQQQQLSQSRLCRFWVGDLPGAKPH